MSKKRVDRFYEMVDEMSAAHQGPDLPGTVPDKLQPHNFEAEEAVLGALLIDPDRIVQVTSFLQPEDFYIERFGWVYSAIKDMWDRDQTLADLVTLTDELRRRKKLEKVGGSAYLTGLINSTPTSSGLSYYAKIVERTSWLRGLIDAAGQIAQLAHKDDTDADAIQAKAEEIILGRRRDTTVGLRHISEVADKAKVNLKELAKNPEANIMWTGIPQLDKLLITGIGKGTLDVLCGETSRGKTALAMQIARHNSIEGNRKGAIFSLEADDWEAILRWLPGLTGIKYGNIRVANFQPEDWDTINHTFGELSKKNIWICDKGGLELEDFLAEIRRLIMMHGDLDYVIADYLQLFRTKRRFHSLREQVTYTTGEMKNFARTVGTRIFLLSQPSRDSTKSKKDNRRLMLGDLKESGSIENDADLALFIQPGAAFEDDEDVAAYLTASQQGKPTKLVVLDIQKYRGGQRDAHVAMAFNGTLQTFFPLVEKPQEQEIPFG